MAKSKIRNFGARVLKAAHDYRRLERRNGGSGITKGMNQSNMDAIEDARQAAKKYGLPENRLTFDAIVSVARAFELNSRRPTT